MTTQTAITTMVERIVERFDPIRILLFGSQARGTANRHSDVDLLVVMGDGTDRRRTAIEIRRILRDMPVAKDVVVSTPEEIARRGNIIGPVLSTALREGKLLYERP